MAEDNEVVFTVSIDEEKLAEIEKIIDRKVEERLRERETQIDDERFRDIEDVLTKKLEDRLEKIEESDPEVKEELIKEIIDDQLGRRETKKLREVRDEVEDFMEERFEKERLRRERLTEQQAREEAKIKEEKAKESLSDYEKHLLEQKELEKEERRRERHLESEGKGPLGELRSSFEGRLTFLENEQQALAQTIGKFNQISSQAHHLLANPGGFIEHAVASRLLHFAGPLGIAFTAAMTAPEVLTQIIRQLSQKGRPLNRDWRRAIEEEVTGMFSIEENMRRLLGIDSFIVTQHDRYSPDLGASVVNSLENKHSTITSTYIASRERAIGIR